MESFNDGFMNQLFTNAAKQGRNSKIERPPVKDDLTEAEAMQIYNELIEVIVKHNVSYKNACRIAVSLSEAFLIGAVELYENEQ